MSTIPGIDPTAPPSGAGCVECLETDDQWWFHLRRCAQCGHVGCCDSSPGKHGSSHATATGHPIIQSFEPGEDWVWSFETNEYDDGAPTLASPTSHPAEQPVPGPAGRVPSNWQELLND